MIQTHLFVTQTYLNKEKVYQDIASNFFYQEQLKFSVQKNDTNFWESYLNKGRILLPIFDSKANLSEQILNLFINYAEPTLLFLGDIAEFSVPLQEGLLKILEEPPKNLFIVLLAPGLYKLLPTITSRSLVHNLDKEYIYTNLNDTLIAKIAKKLPKASEFTKNYLQDIFMEIDNISKLEREEIDLWLWQIGQCIESLILTKETDIFYKKLSMLILARKLNQSNVQKKLVLASLWDGNVCT